MVLLGEKSDVLFYDVGNGERSDSCHAGVVAFTTLFVAVNGAGATVQVLLYNLAAVWLQSGEAGKGVGGSPYRDDRSAHKRTEVHICRVHAQHGIEMSHHLHFDGKSFTFAGERMNRGAEFCSPLSASVLLLAFSAKEPHVDSTLDEAFEHLLHKVCRVNLALMSGKWGYADVDAGGEWIGSVNG